jgi:hypothetical protein
MEGIWLWEFETAGTLWVSGIAVNRVLVPAMSAAEAMSLVGIVAWAAPESAEFLALRGPRLDETVTEPSLLLSKEGLFALASGELNEGWTPLCDRLQACLDRELTWRGGSALRGVPDYVLIDRPGKRLAGQFNEGPHPVALQRERRSSAALGLGNS